MTIKALDDRQKRSLKLMVQTGDYTLDQFTRRFGVSQDRIIEALKEMGLDHRAARKTLPSGKRPTVLR